MTMKNLKPKRHQEERENGTGSKNCLRDQNAAGASVEGDKEEMGALYLEMEDWYRGEEKHGMVEAV
jgi:hypothetical protein